MYYNMGQWDQAFDLYKSIAETYPDHLTPRIQMAEIELKRGNIQESKILAQEVLSITPRVKSDTYERNKARAQKILK